MVTPPEGGSLIASQTDMAQASHCDDFRPLIPRYLDGELADEAASPLRKHLLSCQECRAQVQDGESLSHWFVEPPAVPVPAGFAQRVARRAMAGDTGEREDVLVPHRSSRPAPLHPVEAVAPVDAAPAGKLHEFVLQLTAAAAIVLFVGSILLRQASRPEVDAIHADEVTKDDVLQELDELNRMELEAQEGDSAASEEGTQR